MKKSLMVTVVPASIRKGRTPGNRLPFQSALLPLPSITNATPEVGLSMAAVLAVAGKPWSIEMV